MNRHALREQQMKKNMFYLVFSKFRNLGSVYTERQHQCCDDTSDTVLIENNGVIWKCIAILEWLRCFQSDQYC